MLNETPIFIDNAGQKLFCILHIPDNIKITKAIVFCHAFAEEKLWSHRAYVTLARKLVKLGFLVLRFDYRGYGDSEGDFLNCTAETYKNDIEHAVSFIRSSYSDLTELGLFGHRLGASLALTLKDSIKINGPLILWDPIVDGDRYIQEFLRSHLSTQLAIYNEIRETREDLVKKLQNGDVINIEGYDLSNEHYNSISKINLMDEHPSTSSRCLIVQTGRNEKPKKDMKLLSEHIEADLHCVIEEPFWRETKYFYFEAKNMNDVTSNWLDI